MLDVSAQYKTDISKQFRNRSYANIRFRMYNIDAAKDATVSVSDEASYSYKDSVVFESAKIDGSYATLEDDRFVLDGSQSALPSSNYTNYDGYVSDVLSEHHKVFAAPMTHEEMELLTHEELEAYQHAGIPYYPTIQLQFSVEYDIIGLVVEFDSETSDYLSWFTVDYYHLDDSPIMSVDCYPTSDKYMLTNAIVGCGKLIITMKESSEPYRRARIRQLMLGIEQTFTDDTIQSINTVEDVDPISRRLPTETIRFSILDFDGLYDPDSPNSYWEYVDMLAPVGLTWMYTLDDGTIESLPEIQYRLDGQPKLNGHIVEFAGNRELHNLENIYYKGAFATKTLYELAEAVLTDALNPVAGQDLWDISTTLQSISTTAPLPIATHRECLQMIAVAGNCALYTDSDGRITLETGWTNSPLTGITIDYDTQLKLPKIERIPPVRAIDAYKYDYVEEASSRDIFEGDFDVTGTETIHIEYSMSKSVSLNISGGTIDSSNIYASAADIVVTVASPSSVTITATGKPVEQVASSKPYIVNATIAGETEIVENPLVTNQTMQRNIGLYRSRYLRMRSSYSIDYRGNPELESGDLVRMETNATEQTVAMLLKNTISYNGALRGTAIIKKMEFVADKIYTTEIYTGESIGVI